MLLQMQVVKKLFHTIQPGMFFGLMFVPGITHSFFEFAQDLVLTKGLRKDSMFFSYYAINSLC